MKKIIKKLYNNLQEYKANRLYSELKVNRSEIKRLKKGVGGKTTSLFDKKIEITDFYWYIHGLNEIFLEKTYLFKASNEKPLILDCGANIGLSVIFFKQLYPNSRIIAFEADKDITKTLISNLHTFSYDDVEVIPKAVWTSNTVLGFDPDGGVGGRVIEVSNPENKIDAVRLKDYLNTTVDFLKIDIEGAEYEVIEDCKDKLVNVNNLFVEYHSYYKEEQKLDEILFILKQAGFKYYIKEAWNNQPMPYVDKHLSHYDLQLNIFAYRP
ncbi:MAG: FkbM family methyltransferase [Dysgonomonas sp.]